MKDDPLIGAQLGAYRIQSLLGEGGMARVYKAFHNRLQREVAIKIILPEFARKGDFQRRFEHEAQLIAKLHHRNIVTVYDFGENQDMLYLAMQYVGGGTLRDQLVNNQPLEPRRAALYALQVARALYHAHQYGIVHRDVKPMNMLITATNRNELLLSDFGLAKLSAQNPETPLAVQGLPNGEASVVGDVTGTPRYMAPEQCLGQAIDARTDIYALGVVLFEMLTGRLPFHGETTFALLHQHAFTPAPSVREVNPFVPEALAQITARALAKKPEDRFQSAKEMGQALEYFLSQPAPITPLQPGPQRGVRKPLMRYIFGGVLLVLFAIVQILFSSGIIHWPITASAGSTANTSTQSAGATGQTPNCAIGQTTTQAQPFTETFQDKQRGWRENTGNGIVSTIGGNAYTLNVGNRNDTLFLCPDSGRVGTLPAAFTLTTQIAQTQGGSDAFYGVAFHLSYDQNTNKASTYAFVVNGHGIWAILKYDPQVPTSPTTLTSGKSTSMHPSPANNILQVIAQGSKFSFKLNDTALAVNSDGQNGQVVTDQSYSGGLLALVVSGPNTSFVVHSVSLTIP